ncbi:l-psp endoribonuclease family [Colletotrichum incanum]|uniref:L-psp endoribonuclease family n=1 Tax=Colletotrichum incanum TaxID=1573173 RepID=A0A162QA62_COLIC|nr:l-psp endoribonuclease family [Colletotrichum incanum]
MSNNGDAVILPIGAVKGLANYPRGRLAPATVHRTLYISGTSSRRPDGTFAGVRTNSSSPLNSFCDAKEPSERSNPQLDVREQTAAILHNIEDVIRHATSSKGGLGNIIDATVFLVDMKRDYAGMNEVWNRFWPSFEEAPARTTVGVRELPGEEMVVEIKCTAVVEGKKGVKYRRLAEGSNVLERQPESISGQLLRLAFRLRDCRIPSLHSSLVDELRQIS